MICMFEKKAMRSGQKRPEETCGISNVNSEFIERIKMSSNVTGEGKKSDILMIQ